MTHKGHEYLIICDTFSKYPFIYKVTTKSAQSLCTCLLEVISQNGPPMSLSTHNGPPFASDELAEFLMCHHIAHHTSSPTSQGLMGSLKGRSELARLPSTLPYQQTGPLWQFCWISDPPLLGQTCQHHMRSCTTGQSSTRQTFSAYRSGKGQKLFNLQKAGPVWPIQQVTEFEPYQNFPRPRSPVQVPSRWWIHPWDYNWEDTSTAKLYHWSTRQKVLQNKGTHVAHTLKPAPGPAKCRFP